MLEKKNDKDIFDKEYKFELDNALDINKFLFQAYYLKEQMRKVWIQINKDNPEDVLLNWIYQAKESKVPLPHIYRKS